MSIFKASETGDPPEAWGVQAKCGQIPRNEAYGKVRRSASGPEGLRPGGTRNEGNPPKADKRSRWAFPDSLVIY